MFEAMLDSFVLVNEQLADRDQLRTGSDVEQRSLACMEQMRPVLSRFVERTNNDSPAEVEEAMALAGSAVAVVLMGQPTPWFDVVCWNEANAVAEGVQSPYLAASMLRLESDHGDAVDRFGIVGPLSDLLVRYEDEPDSREATGAEIVAVLDDFRAHAPWPVVT